jgi:CheY-like chemotaxis protein
MKDNQTHRALVIDDVELNRRLLTVHMKHFDIDYDEAGDGLEALEHCEKTDYDLMLVDLKMPVMDGPTFIKTYKARYPNKATFIVGVSANVFDKDKQSFINAGADAFIPKPVMKETLHTVMQHFFDHCSSQPQADTEVLVDVLQSINQEKAESLWGSRKVYEECLTSYLDEYEHYTHQDLLARLDSPDTVHAMKSLALTLGLDKLTHLFEQCKAASPSPELKTHICEEIDSVCTHIRALKAG